MGTFKEGQVVSVFFCHAYHGAVARYGAGQVSDQRCRSRRPQDGDRGKGVYSV